MPSKRDRPSGLRVATFACDATPPIGSPLGYGLVPPALSVTDRLSARGIVLTGSGDPIVLCAVDWIGIAGSGHRNWRRVLADAAGTATERVVVHALHQHDAPGSDPDAEAIMRRAGLPYRGHDQTFIDSVVDRTRVAVHAALAHTEPVTHVGIGTGEVARVASNRRLLGSDGKVWRNRMSSAPDPALRAAPEGVTDRLARAITLWNDTELVAVLTFYATHPQSHYRERRVSSDFVGLAREHLLQARPGALHVHFCGAAGNVAAGKYNDGSPGLRDELSRRLADGLDAAIAAAEVNKTSVTAADVSWSSVPVALPLAPFLADGGAEARFEVDPRFWVAAEVAWARRARAGDAIEIASLGLGPARTVHLPGEPFVEYQLAASALLPDGFVATAGYGDYGPGYIGTTAAYPQGGYETGYPSRVAPQTESVLFTAIRDVLGAEARPGMAPSDFTDTEPISVPTPHE